MAGRYNVHNTVNCEFSSIQYSRPQNDEVRIDIFFTTPHGDFLNVTFEQTDEEDELEYLVSYNARLNALQVCDVQNYMTYSLYNFSHNQARELKYMLSTVPYVGGTARWVENSQPKVLHKFLQKPRRSQ